MLWNVIHTYLKVAVIIRRWNYFSGARCITQDLSFILSICDGMFLSQTFATMPMSKVSKNVSSFGYLFCRCWSLVWQSWRLTSRCFRGDMAKQRLTGRDWYVTLTIKSMQQVNYFVDIQQYRAVISFCGLESWDTLWLYGGADKAWQTDGYWRRILCCGKCTGVTSSAQPPSFVCISRLNLFPRRLNLKLEGSHCRIHKWILVWKISIWWLV